MQSIYAAVAKASHWADKDREHYAIIRYENTFHVFKIDDVVNQADVVCVIRPGYTAEQRDAIASCMSDTIHIESL